LALAGTPSFDPAFSYSLFSGGGSGACRRNLAAHRWLEPSFKVQRPAPSPQAPQVGLFLKINGATKSPAVGPGSRIRIKSELVHTEPSAPAWTKPQRLSMQKGTQELNLTTTAITARAFCIRVPSDFSNRSEPFECAIHRASSHAGGREGTQCSRRRFRTSRHIHCRCRSRPRTRRIH
jgi:hypothetical protein